LNRQDSSASDSPQSAPPNQVWIGTGATGEAQVPTEARRLRPGVVDRFEVALEIRSLRSAAAVEKSATPASRRNDQRCG
jgi:hypothetical protein